MEDDNPTPFAEAVTAMPSAQPPGVDTLTESRVEHAQAAPRPSTENMGVGMMLGRYVVLSRLGAGGMGVVFAAYDPELDRKVALKLISPRLRASDDQTEARARLVREAQALAKLSHPAVVAVHDVGIMQDHVFVAMEFVAGRTLGAWTKQARRSWREITQMFVQAGRGLAAAHSVGILHRDFKPDNVLVGDDGRVRVIDFGLARSEARMPLDLSTPRAHAQNTPFHTQLTVTGALIGTPSYMAPEQFVAGAIDARTDQFSFCIALYEALYGARPFAGDTLAALTTAVTGGAVEPTPRGSSVPGWLRRVVLRGLSVESKARFGSMDELLQALARDPGRVIRTRVLPAAVGVIVVAMALTYVRRPDGSDAQLCTGAERKLAAIWPATAPRIQAAFMRTGVPYAADAYRGVATAFDRYSQSWTTMYTEACEATALRHEQSEELLDLRMACLSRRAAELEAQTAIFGTATSATVGRAVHAATALTPLDECDNRALLIAPIAPPRGVSARAQVESIRGGLATIQAMTSAGLYTEALALEVKASAVPGYFDYRPAKAEALLLRGRLQDLTGDPVTAEATLREAELAALAANDEPLLAQIWAELIALVGGRGGRFAEAEAWARYAEAVSERLPEASRAVIADAHGTMRTGQGRYADALVDHRRALEIYQRTLGPDHPKVADTLANIARTQFELNKFPDALDSDRKALAIRERLLGASHPDVAQSYNSIGRSLYMQGTYHDALIAHRRALTIREQALGPRHIDVATTLNDIGSTLQELGQLDDAVEHHRRAVEIMEQALGAKHPGLAKVLSNYGNALQRAQRFEEALVAHQRALAIGEQTLGRDHPEVARFNNNLGETLKSLYRYDAALACYRRGLAIVEAKLSADHPKVGGFLINIADVLVAQGKPAEALGVARRALGIMRRALGDKHPYVAYALVVLGKAQLAGGKPLEAVQSLDAALAIPGGIVDDANELASARFALARALWGSNGDRARAGVLVHQARAHYAKTAASRHAAEVDRWLASHR